MKTVLLISTLFCLTFTTQFINSFESRKVLGAIYNESGEPVPGADVFITGTKKGTQTDSLGIFEMLVPVNTPSLTVSHPKYKQITIEIQSREMKIILKTIPYDETLAIKRERSSSDILFKRGIEPKEMLAAAPVMAGEFEHSDKGIVEAKMDASVSKWVEEVDYSGISDDRKEMEISAGQLTAGEWNDLNNWEAWNELIEEKDYQEMAEYWGLSKKERVSVFVTNQFELPVPDCVVTLKSEDQIVWTSKTDNAGKAELWAEEDMKDLTIEVDSREQHKEISKVLRGGKLVNPVKLVEECAAPLKAEVMFVVDATGSMGDEIEFLKSELKDVIDQVEAMRSNVQFEWGSVFYRDHSDAYLTMQSPLTSKTKRTLDFIQMQSAGGGGDYPEAVNEGLEEALMQEWSHDAIARIVFLVLDAPPHHDEEVLADLQSQIEFASAMGIKIIPITASGINRQTEYLMKFMAIMTNGTYVFLTDDSGIGNPHLEPVVSDFEVEKLNELLIRLVKNYTDPGHCTRQEDNDPIFAQIEVFPNPTVDRVQMKIPRGVTKISLTTNSGMIVHSEQISNQSELSIDLSSYVDGMYVVNFFTDEKIYSIKVIKSGRV
ncbi:carboxypeptidase regulatory-like domain-containing protein [Portibacter marinus]|uniref:carboxypeptidase regulatory-like domain-containing protein n=1 Tax=Portibacter marinus TaxID=2898660 RepID=UPI001F21CCEA|nr:carboxypeptidase regulatory-like domain-containing protein [Portibacter marinus]